MRLTAWLMLGAATFLMARSRPAMAIDLDLTNGLDTETIARRERSATYDSHTVMGAERVAEHDRKEFGPDGIRAGSYLVYPKLGTAVVYDDNIFASNANKQADVRAEVRPEVIFKSDLPRHRLDLSLGGKIVEYTEHTDQSYADAHANAVGALHFDAAHTLSASVMTAIEHEERQDSTAYRFAAEPAQVWHNKASVGITRDVGRLYGTLSGTWEAWKYYDVKATDGSNIAQSSRDLDAFSAQVAAGYRISPGFDAIARARVSRFLNDGGPGTFSRTGTGYEALAGLAFEANPLVRFRLLGGWAYRDFDEKGLAGTQAWLAEGEMQWLVTQAVTFYATATRSLSDQLSAEGTSLTTSALNARLEYELWHNLVLTAGGGVAQAEFGGTGRTDTTYTARLGLDYYANKNWLFTFGYEHQIRESSDAAFDMTRERFTVGAKLRF